MFSAVGLFLGLKSKILHEQNVIDFQFYVRLPNFRLLGSIIYKKKSQSRSIPLSTVYFLRLKAENTAVTLLKLVMVENYLNVYGWNDSTNQCAQYKLKIVYKT